MYLLQDHLKSSSVFVTQAGNTVATNYYYPYGGNRGGSFSTLSTKRFTGQYHESSLPGGEGLSYYNARWYDPKLGRFLSADTIVPGSNNPQAFNRYSYVLNNPLRFIDPTGHETTKPDWWPPFLPYPFDLPDGTTEADFNEWMSENNGVTTWGVQAGGDANLTPFLGGTGSVEFAYMFNWLSGEVMLSGTTGVGGYGGSPDLGFQAHGGVMVAVAASSIEESILGLSEYTTVNGEIEAAGQEMGVSGTWARGVKNLGDDSIWVPGKDYIDPVFDRTVDTLNINLSVGVDAISSPVVPVDGGIAHGLSQTREVYSFNLYYPFVVAWNWVVRK